MRIDGEGRPNMHGVMAPAECRRAPKTLLDPELIRCVAKSGARAPDRAESTSPKTKVPSQSSVKSQQKHAVSTQALA
jgi:hypothetical protein